MRLNDLNLSNFSLEFLELVVCDYCMMRQKIQKMLKLYSNRKKTESLVIHNVDDGWLSKSICLV